MTAVSTSPDANIHPPRSSVGIDLTFHGGCRLRRPGMVCVSGIDDVVGEYFSTCIAGHKMVSRSVLDDGLLAVAR